MSNTAVLRGQRAVTKALRGFHKAHDSLVLAEAKLQSAAKEVEDAITSKELERVAIRSEVERTARVKNKIADLLA